MGLSEPTLGDCLNPTLLMFVVCVCSTPIDRVWVANLVKHTPNKKKLGEPSRGFGAKRESKAGEHKSPRSCCARSLLPDVDTKQVEIERRNQTSPVKSVRKETVA